jgi:hypothetical protein
MLLEQESLHEERCRCVRELQREIVMGVGAMGLDEGEHNSSRLNHFFEGIWGRFINDMGEFVKKILK